jgi:hypothetical protein
MKTADFLVALSLVACTSFVPCRADLTSTAFNQKETIYSKEKPDAAYFGTGESGKRNEASILRFQGEQDLGDKKIDEAVRKLSKAVELDPADPTTHVLYARAITAKFFANEGPINEKEMAKCMGEWNMIYRHDADYLEQSEARAHLRRLNRLAKALAKEKKEKAKELLAAKKHQKAN